jgi:hypothetical protein
MAESNAGPAAEAEEVARHRRKFLTGGLAAGAAALGAWSLASAQPARADTGDALILGETPQTAGAVTGLLMEANPYSRPALAIATNGQGAAVEGEAAGGGPGVRGISIRGPGVANAGVVGEADDPLGVGVYGTGDIGVQGDSPGVTANQIGVKGTAEGPTGAGVQGTGFKGVEGRSGNYGVYGAGSSVSTGRAPSAPACLGIRPPPPSPACWQAPRPAAASP